LFCLFIQIEIQDDKLQKIERRKTTI